MQLCGDPRIGYLGYPFIEENDGFCGRMTYVANIGRDMRRNEGNSEYRLSHQLSLC